MDDRKSRSGVTSMDLKEINRRKLFTYVYRNGPVSKQEMSSSLDLSIPTINQYLKTFTESDIIIADGTFRSTGGRKAIAYKCNPDSAYAAGVYMTRSSFYISVINLTGEVIASKRCMLPFSPDDAYGKELHALLHETLNSAGVPSDKMCGTGFAVPGLLSPEGDEIMVQFSPSLCKKPWSFSHISKFCRFPYIADNDANFGGYCEAWENDFTESFFYMHIGGGVGGAIILDGVQYEGSVSASAEVGHMIVDAGKKKCRCGRSGCLESFISEDVLSDDLGISLDTFFRELPENKEYQAIFSRYLDYLAIGISNLRMLFGLDIVIAGEVTRRLLPYEKEIAERLKALDIIESEPYFRFSENKRENAGSFGAALKVISQYIQKI